MRALPIWMPELKKGVKDATVAEEVTCARSNGVLSEAEKFQYLMLRRPEMTQAKS